MFLPIFSSMNPLSRTGAYEALMKHEFRLNYFLIPLLTILVAVVGSELTRIGIDDGWYAFIVKPKWVPAGQTIGSVWTILYFLATASALIFWNRSKRTKRFWITTSLFLFNALCNMIWPLFFFALHRMGIALIDAALITLSVLLLICYLWNLSRPAAFLLLPYLLWSSFATYLNFTIWRLNT
jgi:tryptophan-rich sensory protein